MAEISGPMVSHSALNASGNDCRAQGLRVLARIIARAHLANIKPGGGKMAYEKGDSRHKKIARLYGGEEK